MRRAVLLLLTLVSATATAEIRVAVVLDASEQMWAQLADGRPGFVAARMALQAWVLERSSDTELVVELRLVGGTMPTTEAGSCEDVTRHVPPGPAAAPTWFDALEDIRPTGRRPILLAVAGAAEDLGPGSDPRRIVLITSGEDGCFGGRKAAVEALSSGADLRIVGVGLSGDAVKWYEEVGPTRNATSTVSLLAALRWAVEELPSAIPTEAPVRIHIDATEPIVGATLVHVITGDRRELGPERDRFVGEALPGVYALELARDGDGPPEVHDGVRIAASSGLDLELELQLPPPLADLEIIPDRTWSGGPLFVSFGSVGSGAFETLLVSRDEPSSAWLDRAEAAGPGATVELRAPDDPGASEIRLAEQLGDGVRRVIARSQIEIVDPAVVVDAPAEIRPFEALAVPWTGPDNPGDHLVVVPAEGPPSSSAACTLTTFGSPAELTAPGEEGFWEVRYISGLTGRTFAASPVEVTAVIVTLDAPAEIAAGRTFDVAWEGPAGTADYLAVAAEEDPDDEYVELFLTSSGNPARFTAPREPGSYEIRYVEGDDGRVRRRAPLTVVDTPVRLRAPRKVRAGSRFDVRWTGPDRPGDFVAVARPGSAPQVSEDWAYTSTGSPTSLAAPFEPGRFEIRYVTGRGREILDSIPVVVQ